MKDKTTRFATSANTQQLPNSLVDEKLSLLQNDAVEENNFVGNPVLSHSRTSQNEESTASSNLSGMLNIKMAEVQNNIDPIPQILPEVTLNVAGNVYDTVPTTVMKTEDDDEHLKLLQKVVESVPENSEDEVNSSVTEKPVTLVLKPIAKAVAGAKGIAIAAPLSRAVVRHGQETNIHFNPDAVAVVGPGGVADAHSDLVISYFKDHPSQKKASA
jgi:hypothetical protein